MGLDHAIPGGEWGVETPSDAQQAESAEAERAKDGMDIDGSDEDGSEDRDGLWARLNTRSNITAHELHAAFCTERWQSHQALLIVSRLAQSVADGGRINVEVALAAVAGIVKAVLTLTCDSINESPETFMSLVGLFQALETLNRRFPEAFDSSITELLSHMRILRGRAADILGAVLQGQMHSFNWLHGSFQSTTGFVTDERWNFFLEVDTNMMTIMAVLKRICRYRISEGLGEGVCTSPNGKSFSMRFVTGETLRWWAGNIGFYG